MRRRPAAAPGLLGPPRQATAGQQRNGLERPVRGCLARNQPALQRLNTRRSPPAKYLNTLPGRKVLCHGQTTLSVDCRQMSLPVCHCVCQGWQTKFFGKVLWQRELRGEKNEFAMQGAAAP